MKRRYIVIVTSTVVVAVILILLFFNINRAKKVSEVPVNSSFSSLVKEAKIAIGAGNLIEAKELYQKAISQEQDPDRLKAIQKEIEQINTKIIFSPVIDECSTTYVVKPKDALFKIAESFGTTVSLIQRANNLSSDTIRPAQELKINSCKFSLVIDKSQNLLFLKRKGEVIKTYLVSTGKDNSTPRGSFKIINKLTNPTWFRTGAVIPPNSPDNILGSRWMGFDLKGYGIHGTTEPNNLGKQITLGCIRMSDKDVEELFDIVPQGTEVIIID